MSKSDSSERPENRFSQIIGVKVGKTGGLTGKPGLRRGVLAGTDFGETKERCGGAAQPLSLSGFYIRARWKIAYMHKSVVGQSSKKG